MKRLLPGTVLEMDPGDPEAAEKIIGPMFLAGGLVLSQVAQLTGLEPYMIQNWVKRGFLSPPVGKKYSRQQVCRILIINMLKNTVQLERLCALLSCLASGPEGVAGAEEDLLYFCLIRLIVRAARQSGTLTERELDALAEDYEALFPGKGERVCRVLKTLLILWHSAQLRQRAETFMTELGA